MIALWIVPAYLAVAAYTGGLLYHRTGLDQPPQNSGYYSLRESDQQAKRWSGTVLGALFWPLAVVAVIAYRRAQLATVRPVVEQEVARALDVEKAQRDVRVARLEQQLGLGGDL